MSTSDAAGPGRRRAGPARLRGVTLIELLTVVTVIAIIAGLAVSGYRESVRRSNRSEATTSVLRVASAQEKFFLQNGRYADNAELVAAPPGGLGIAAVTEREMYDLTIANVDPGRDFTVTATVRAGGPQQDDRDCWTFSATEAGVRTAANDGGGDNTRACWR